MIRRVYTHNILPPRQQYGILFAFCVLVGCISCRKIYAGSMTEEAYKAGIHSATPEERERVFYNYFHKLRKQQGLHEDDAQLQISSPHPDDDLHCHAVTEWQPSRDDCGNIKPRYPQTCVYLHERMCYKKEYIPLTLYILQHELGHCWQFVQYKRMHRLEPDVKDTNIGDKIHRADASFNGTLPLCYPNIVKHYSDTYIPREVDADIHAFLSVDDASLMKHWITSGFIPEYGSGYLSNNDRLALLQ